MKKMRKVKLNRNQKVFLYSVSIMFLCLLTIFFMFMKNINLAKGSYIDKKAINYVYSIRNEKLNKIFIFITSMGNVVPTIILTGLITVFFIYSKKTRAGVFYASYVLSVFIGNELIKRIFERPRPDVTRLVVAKGYSFPSGHAMVSMGAALLLIYFVTEFMKSKSIAQAISILIFIYVIFIGLSRVYVGVHYISDVFGAWVFSSVFAFIGVCIWLLINIEK